MNSSQENCEDLSITVIPTTNKAQQDKIEFDHGLYSKSCERIDLPTLTHYAENDTGPPECKPNLTQIVNTDIPSKRKRGRPKKNVSGLDVSRILAAYHLPDGIPSPSYHGISRQQLDRIQGQTIGGSVLPANPVKRGRGRPRVHASEIPGVQDYNVAHLPYGDLNYLTSQYNAHTTAEDDEESPVIMEPLVEINMDQNETNRDASTSQSQSNVLERENAVEITRIMKPIETRYVEIPEGNIKEEQTEDINSQERIDISEIENKIGLIGECTISVAN